MSFLGLILWGIGAFLLLVVGILVTALWQAYFFGALAILLALSILTVTLSQKLVNFQSFQRTAESMMLPLYLLTAVIFASLWMAMLTFVMGNRSWQTIIGLLTFCSILSAAATFFAKKIVASEGRQFVAKEEEGEEANLIRNGVSRNSLVGIGAVLFFMLCHIIAFIILLNSQMTLHYDASAVISPVSARISPVKLETGLPWNCQSPCFSFYPRLPQGLKVDEATGRIDGRIEEDFENTVTITLHCFHDVIPLNCGEILISTNTTLESQNIPQRKHSQSSEENLWPFLCLAAAVMLLLCTMELLNGK